MNSSNIRENCIQTAKAEKIPAVSILMPFETSMSLKSDLQKRMRKNVEKVERELLNNYGKDKTGVIINKLKNVPYKLNYYSDKKSMAIFLSEKVEKIFYMDIEVNEKMVVDGSLELRNLVETQEEKIQFLVMVFGLNSCKVYLGKQTNIILIKYNDTVSGKESARDRTPINSESLNSDKQVVLESEEFLRQMDQRLSLIIKNHPFPVFVCALPNILEQFKSLSTNLGNIARYIPGNFIENTEAGINCMMEPILADWISIKENYLIQRLESAAKEQKLVYGINEVWTSAHQNNSHLLVVEKDYASPTYNKPPEENDGKSPVSPSKAFFIKDAVDEVIEKVLDNGGNVEIVTKGALGDFMKIALIQFY